METFGTAQRGRTRREGRMDLPSSRTPVQVRRTVRSGVGGEGEPTKKAPPGRTGGDGGGTQNGTQNRSSGCAASIIHRGRRRRCLRSRSRSQRAPARTPVTTGVACLENGRRGVRTVKKAHRDVPAFAAMHVVGFAGLMLRRAGRRPASAAPRRCVDGRAPQHPAKGERNP